MGRVGASTTTPTDETMATIMPQSSPSGAGVKIAGSGSGVAIIPPPSPSSATLYLCCARRVKLWGCSEVSGWGVSGGNSGVSWLRTSSLALSSSACFSLSLSVSSPPPPHNLFKADRQCHTSYRILDVDVSSRQTFAGIPTTSREVPPPFGKVSAGVSNMSGIVNWLRECIPHCPASRSRHIPPVCHLPLYILLNLCAARAQSSLPLPWIKFWCERLH